MKTLILTSVGRFIMKNNIDEFLPKKIKDCKIAYISTASKKVNDDCYALEHQKLMSELNFNYTVIDIAKKNEDELREILKGYDIIFVEGGNAYYLLRCVRDSGFDKVVKELISQGVVYVGSSAGSYLATPSMITATLTERGFDRYEITDFTAMNLVPFIIKAHYTTEMMTKLKEIKKQANCPLRVLTDDQAILVRDEKFELIGEGKEIII